MNAVLRDVAAATGKLLHEEFGDRATELAVGALHHVRRNDHGLPIIPGVLAPVATGVELVARELATIIRAEHRKEEQAEVDPGNRLAQMRKSILAERAIDATRRGRTIRDLPEGGLY
jgi:hypothetical protein